MAVPPDVQEPLSPELVLVAPPDEARAAREHLEDAPGSEWDEFLARVRDRPEPAPDVESTAEPTERPKRRSRRPLVLAGVALLVVSLAVGIALAGDRAPQRAAQPTAPTATSHTRTTPVAPAAPRKKPTPKSTPVAPKRTHSTAAKPTRTAKPKVRAKGPARAKRGTGFVPARVWSWPKAKSSPHYLVRFFRNGHKVLAVRTARPRLVLPKRFTFRAGRYRWTVVPISSRGKVGRALVNSTFVVGR